MAKLRNTSNDCTLNLRGLVFLAPKATIVVDDGQWARMRTGDVERSLMRAGVLVEVEEVPAASEPAPEIEVDAE